MTDTLKNKAINCEGIAAFACTYSFCSLVSDMTMYEDMIDSFVAAGFKQNKTEFLYIDNTKTNRFDAYSGINYLISRAKGQYIILCHQDIVAIDNQEKLSNILNELEHIDPLWGVAGNAGFTANQEMRIRISDKFGSNQKIGPFPSQVVSLDENFIILKAEANLACSSDLKGFHLYGTDIVTQASLQGRNSYVVDFHLEHLGNGSTGKSFVDCQISFEEKYIRALKPRQVKTNSTMTYLGKPSMLTKFAATKKKKKLLR